MSANAKQKTSDQYERDLKEFDRMTGPRPLPPRFGEIDITSPFDPQRYFTMLRSAGAHPHVWRHEEKTMYCLQCCEPGMFHGPSELEKRLFDDACAWSNGQDEDRTKMNLFLSEIVASKPAGNFIHYLGC